MHHSLRQLQDGNYGQGRWSGNWVIESDFKFWDYVTVDCIWAQLLNQDTVEFTFAVNCPSKIVNLDKLPTHIMDSDLNCTHAHSLTGDLEYVHRR